MRNGPDHWLFRLARLPGPREKVSVQCEPRESRGTGLPQPTQNTMLENWIFWMEIQ